jgi:hypothetical protein
VAGSCEHGNDSGSIKGGEFLHKLSVLLASQGLSSMVSWFVSQSACLLIS